MLAASWAKGEDEGVMRATWSRVQAAVVERITALGLADPRVNPPLPLSVVSHRTLAGALASSPAHPGIYVTREDGRMAEQSVAAGGPNLDGSLGLKDRTYPVYVWLTDRQAELTYEGVELIDGWTDPIANAFGVWPPLPTVASVWQVLVLPLPVVDPGRDWYQYVRSGMVLQCQSREPMTGLPAI